MVFIAIVLALALERYFDWSHLRSWQWLPRYHQLLSRYVDHLQPALRILCWIAPLVLLVGLVERLLSGWFFGLFSLVFDFVILLYCFGPTNFWAQLYSCLQPMAAGDAKLTATRVKAAFPEITVGSSQSLHQALVPAIFVEGERRVFAILFWFTLLGPMGAVLYRLVTLINDKTQADFAFYGTKTLAILDWLPARLLGIFFALGGNFVRVLGQWQKYALEGLDSSLTLIEETGVAALDLPLNKELKEKGEVEKEALQLFDRALVLMLLLSAVVVLVLP